MNEACHEAESLPFPVLIGDIGGTNARFALVRDADTGPEDLPTVRTADFKTIDDAIRKALSGHSAIRPRSALLAVAGPVNGDEIPLTNCDWVIRPHSMFETIGVDVVAVINDFEAQALGVVALDGGHMEKIGTGEHVEGGTRVVLGPGTGLGVASLLHVHGRWVPIPGEGGHVDMGPRTARDHEIFPHIERIGGRVSGEQMLCGRGLVNLYRAVARADGRKPLLTTPEAITTAALDRTDATAREALDMFVTCLGRLAGDLALVLMSRGGVYLTGGIAQKIVPALQAGHFRAAFEDKAPHGALMRTIPSYVITHPRSSIAGLAAYASAPGRFCVTTHGRRWTRP